MSHAALESWRIKDFLPGNGLAAGAATGIGGEWIGADAPGDTYLALIAAGRLEHPYAGRNEAAAEWVRDREWWWHTSCDLAEAAPGERIALVFEGLDTFADVYLDGELIGQADNMFRTWRFDLTGVGSGSHDLAVCFHPTSRMTGDRPLPFWSAFADRISRSRRTAMRKAQFGWGWDWGPDLPTVGIWRPARIERQRAAEVRSVNFSTLSLADSAAHVRVEIELTEPADAVVDLIAPGGTLVASGERRGSGTLELNVASPQLWWTPDLGAQPLYTLAVRIAGSPDYRRQVGIRTLAIDETADVEEPGATFFRFVLNGVPIFAKGANWIPADSFVGAIADESYAPWLERAQAANMNMIRVWGGGIYEPDAFYEACDRLGLLVWQDFMFACGPYPDEDQAFLDNIRIEVEEQVARLRHHPSLAVWCGNNENQAIHWFNDLRNGELSAFEGACIYDKVIPEVLARLDPDTPYRPSSPFGGATPNSMRAGDVHNWTVWHGIPLVLDAAPIGDYETAPEGVAFTRYAEDLARFVSEFGLQGAPDIGTLARWMAPEDLALGSDGLLERIKDIADKASAMMIPVTDLPRDIGEFVAFSQLAQAEGLQFGIEHYRRRKPHCSGALVWQLNDCWPCVSWSLVDYDGVAKPSYYTVSRAFAPVMGSFRGDGEATELWVVNDTLEPVSGSARIAMAALAGGADWCETVKIEVPANASVCVWRGTAASSTDRILTVRSDLFADNRRLLAPVKALALAEARLDVSFRAEGDALAATIVSQAYALAVTLRLDDAGLRYSDNHFDLAAGESRTIMLTHAGGASIDPSRIAVECFNGRVPR